MRISSPERGSAVTGVVRVEAVTGGDPAEVTFFRSTDGGASWILLGTDRDPSDGWTALWNTGAGEGSALLRAAATDGSTHAEHTIEVSVDNPPRVSLTVEPRTFSPNGDGRADLASVVAWTSEPAFLELRLLDAAGGTMAAWSAGLSEAGTTRFFWDGRRKGQVVPGGAYGLMLTATDPAGHRAEVAAPIDVDVEPPRLAWGGAIPDPVLAGRDVVFRVGTWDRARSLTVRILVRDQTGAPLGGVGPLRVRRGRARLRWRAPSRSLTAGRLWAVLVASDDAGNVARSRFFPWRLRAPGPARVLRRIPGAGRAVALTFDDCYDAAGWRRVLDVLRRRFVKATFFCTGEAVLAHPALARRTLRDGHAIGSHGWDHALLEGRGAAFTRSRLERDDAAWWRVARASPAPYFRPPYGAFDRAVVAASGAASFRWVVMWDVDPRDWRRPPAAALVRRVSVARGGSIVVMHAIRGTGTALPAILDALRRRRLRPVALPEMLRLAHLA